MTTLPFGKLPPHLLADLIERLPPDPRVVVGPRPGEDAAVIDMGDRYLVSKTDPITFATDAVSVGSAGVPTFSNALFGQLNSPDTAYRDTSTTNDPGGRIVQLVLRINF